MGTSIPTSNAPDGLYGVVAIHLMQIGESILILSGEISGLIQNMPAGHRNESDGLQIIDGLVELFLGNWLAGQIKPTLSPGIK